MYNLTIKGHAQAVMIVSWLKLQKWNYDLRLKHNDPFSDDYDIVLNNKEQAFMTQLHWGIA